MQRWAARFLPHARLLPLLGLAVVLIAALVIARSVHLSSHGPAFGSTVVVPQRSGTPNLASVWPSCATPRQRQEWAIAIAQAQPDLQTLDQRPPSGSTGIVPAALQQAVQAAGSVVVARATSLDFAPVLDGAYVSVAVSAELTLEDVIAGSPPATLIVGLGVLAPGADCRAILQPLAGQPLITPPARVVLLISGSRPEPVAGTYLLDHGVVTAAAGSPFAAEINGTPEQQFIERLRSAAR